MPNNASTEKRVRQNEKRRRKNKSVRSTIRTRRREIKELLEEGQVEQAEEELPDLYSLCDRASKKGIIHENKASRIKSRTTQKVQKRKEGEAE